VTAVAALPPSVTVAPGTKLVPVNVSAVPPAWFRLNDMVAIFTP